jgi:hypothetical protein
MCPGGGRNFTDGEVFFALFSQNMAGEDGSGGIEASTLFSGGLFRGRGWA